LTYPLFYSTGKRTFLGLVNDGLNAIQRYYLNNFSDGFKQVDLEITNEVTFTNSWQIFFVLTSFVDIEDAFDLFLGNYQVKRDAPSPFPVPKENDLFKIVRRIMNLFV
jgi:hypothetical protein